MLIFDFKVLALLARLFCIRIQRVSPWKEISIPKQINQVQVSDFPITELHWLQLLHSSTYFRKTNTPFISLSYMNYLSAFNKNGQKNLNLEQRIKCEINTLGSAGNRMAKIRSFHEISRFLNLVRAQRSQRSTFLVNVNKTSSNSNSVVFEILLRVEF